MLNPQLPLYMLARPASGNTGVPAWQPCELVVSLQDSLTSESLDKRYILPGYPGSGGQQFSRRLICKHASLGLHVCHVPEGDIEMPPSCWSLKCSSVPPNWDWLYLSQPLGSFTQLLWLRLTPFPGILESHSLTLGECWCGRKGRECAHWGRAPSLPC